MKKFLCVLIICLFSSLALAGGGTQSLQISGKSPSDDAPECDSYAHFCQNAEGSGYDNSETWTEAGATSPNEDYSGANVLRGSQSIEMQDTGSDARITSPAFSATSFYGHFMMRNSAITSNSWCRCWH